MHNGYSQGQDFPPGNYISPQWQNQQPQQMSNAQYNSQDHQQNPNYHQQPNVRYPDQFQPTYNGQYQQPIPQYGNQYSQQHQHQQYPYQEPIQPQYYNPYSNQPQFQQQTPDYQSQPRPYQPVINNNNQFPISQSTPVSVPPTGHPQYQQNMSPQHQDSYSQKSYPNPNTFDDSYVQPPPMQQVVQEPLQQLTPQFAGPSIPQPISNSISQPVVPPQYSSPAIPQPQAQSTSSVIAQPRTSVSPRKRKAEIQITPSKMTPLKLTINSSQQPAPHVKSSPQVALHFDQGFKFDAHNTNSTTPVHSRSPKKLSITACTSEEVQSLMNDNTIKVQNLLDLSNQFWKHACKEVVNIKTKKNLQEYYTLIHLSISSLRKILDFKKIKLDLRIKCHQQIGHILSITSNYISNDNPSSETAEDHYDLALMLCGNKPEYVEQRCFCEVGLLKFLINGGRYKQALKYVNEKIEEWGLQNSSVLIYYKFQVLLLTDSPKAIPFLQNYLSTTESQNSSLNFFKLIEICYAVYQGVSSISNLRTIPQEDTTEFFTGNKSFQLVYYFTSILIQMSTKDINSLDQTESLFKQVALLINDLDETLFSVNFQIPHGGIITSNLDSLTTEGFNIFICLSYGVSLLNLSFEKRKPLKLLSKAMGLVDSSLSKINNVQQSIPFYHNKVEKLNYLKSLITFYKLVESSIMEPVNPSLFKEFKCTFSNLPRHAIDGFNLKELYIIGLQSQLCGDLSRAKTHYKLLLDKQEAAVKRISLPDSIGIGNDCFSSKSVYSELYIFSVSNLLLIVESDLHYFTRVGHNQKVVELTNARTELLDKLQSIINAKHTSANHKYLVSTTILLIHLIYNYENLTIFEINEKVSRILEDFENLKKFPLLCAILLYIKSSTLNSNSDQKQKSSQISFNLAKLGYSPMIRYLSGTLNGSNASIARNLQQAEIQNQKLEKILKTIGKKYDHIHRT